MGKNSLVRKWVIVSFKLGSEKEDRRESEAGKWWAIISIPIVNWALSGGNFLRL